MALRATSRSHTTSSRRPTTTATASTPSAGASKGHTFSNLTGSDKAGFQILRPNGTIAVSFNIDYITARHGIAAVRLQVARPVRR